MARLILAWSMTGLVLAAALSACGGGDSPTPAPVLQSIRIVNNGGEIAVSRSATDYAPSRIAHEATSTGSAPVQFSAALSADDFNRLAALVKAKNLTSTLGTPNSLSAPCRHNGYDIAIVMSDARYQFAIPGTQTCGAALKPELDELLQLNTQLINKYRPAGT
jgi:hypothetical protein